MSVFFISAAAAAAAAAVDSLLNRTQCKSSSQASAPMRPYVDLLRLTLANLHLLSDCRRPLLCYKQLARLASAPNLLQILLPTSTHSFMVACSC
jgi:hypothetical protein